MKDMLEKEKAQETFFSEETSDAIDTIKKKYLTTCGGFFDMPSKNENPLHTEVVFKRKYVRIAPEELRELAHSLLVIAEANEKLCKHLDTKNN